MKPKPDAFYLRDVFSHCRYMRLVLCDWIRAIKLGNLLMSKFALIINIIDIVVVVVVATQPKPLYLQNWLLSLFIRQFNYVILEKWLEVKWVKLNLDQFISKYYINIFDYYSVNYSVCFAFVFLSFRMQWMRPMLNRNGIKGERVGHSMFGHQN